MKILSLTSMRYYFIVSLVLIAACTAVAQEWKPDYTSKYNKNPMVYSIDNQGIINNVIGACGLGAVSAVAGCSKVDILLFNLEGGLGVVEGDILMFYNNFGQVVHTQNITMDNINAGLSSYINLAGNLKYREFRWNDDTYSDPDFNHLVGMLHTMNHFWTIENTQAFSISTHGGNVDAAHNIPENIKCTELSAPDVTVYFKRNQAGDSIEEIMVPEFLKNTRLPKRVVLFKDYNSLSRAEKQEAVSSKLSPYQQAVVPDTFQVVFGRNEEAKQFKFKQTDKTYMTSKSFVAELGEKDILTDINQYSEFMKPNYFFNLHQYNPGGIGAIVKYEENVSGYPVRGIAINDSLNTELSYLGPRFTNLMWCKTVPLPDDTGEVIHDEINIGVFERGGKYYLTNLDWLADKSNPVALKYVDYPPLNVTMHFNRIPEDKGYYERIEPQEDMPVLFTDRNKIYKIEMNEQLISKKLTGRRDVVLQMKVENKSYIGDPLLFMNHIDHPGKHIWETPIPSANPERWSQGYLYPADNEYKLQQKLVLESQPIMVDAEGDNIDFNDPNNRKWLVMQKKPKYSLFIQTGVFFGVLFFSVQALR